MAGTTPPSMSGEYDDESMETVLDRSIGIYREIAQAQQRRRWRSACFGATAGGLAALSGSLLLGWVGALVCVCWWITGYLLGVVSWLPRIDTEARIAEIESRRAAAQMYDRRFGPP